MLWQRVTNWPCRPAAEGLETEGEKRGVSSRSPWRKNQPTMPTLCPFWYTRMASEKAICWPSLLIILTKPREWKALVIIAGITPDIWRMLHTFPEGYYLNFVPNSRSWLEIIMSIWLSSWKRNLTSLMTYGRARARIQRVGSFDYWSISLLFSQLDKMSCICSSLFCLQILETRVYKLKYSHSGFTKQVYSSATTAVKILKPSSEPHSYNVNKFRVEIETKVPTWSPTISLWLG